jgi:8-oxo-dGTP pyrophosphatase MutT (NUDIX family)
MRRGGDQVIPRPVDARPGGPPPWADLQADQRVVDLASMRERLAAMGPPIVIDGPVPVASPRPSAVLAPLYEGPEGPTVVLTRRAAHLRNHRGEVSFPGGRQEDQDADLVATALREAQEEIALEPATVEVIGELDRLSTFTSRSEIHPYVGLLARPPERLVAQPSEVDRILQVPLADLLDPDAFHAERWTFPNGVDRSLFFYEIEGDTIWGATARMLTQLLAVGLGVDPRGP